MEEAGELAQLIGKHRKMSGESNTHLTPKETMDNIASELLDVAQVAITMMYVLEDNYNVDLDKHLLEHARKLINKGYCTSPRQEDLPPNV